MAKKITLVFFLLLLCVIMIIILNDYNNILIPSGLYIGDVDVGGLTNDEARNIFQKLTEEKINKSIILTFYDKQWIFKISEYIEIDVDKSIDNIATYVKSIKKEGIIKRFIFRQQLKKSPLRIDPIIKYKTDKLPQLFDEINEVIMVKPINAVFKTDDDIVHIITDVKGQILDEDMLKKKIKEAIWTENEILVIPVKVWNAEKTKEDLEKMEIRVKIAEYSTEFDKTLKNRTENIRVASEMLNGCIISPGDIFSFNKVVGERTKDKGYKEAPVFINNEVIYDIGGGICQVSSTLYNLALLTDLEIVERMNHSLPVSYVPLGRDATVNYGTIDLKFKNNTGGYLLLTSEITNDKLIVKFFGNKKIDKSVELFSETIKTIPSPIIIKKDFNLEKGEIRIEQGNAGYVVNLWKRYAGEKNEYKVLISSDTYNPTPTLLYVGERVKEITDDENINAIMIQ
ncbi:VanW family protein [Tepidanaerobacter sp. EBM-38]|uniref:VanW family protein n=1 Tax=Tepidanaerobacter sp. EBM-38 TaxID=1918496 RepID=UPI000B1E24FB|nr:VanW family protein [Tepidanaerobacter sp. EBM-38]